MSTKPPDRGGSRGEPALDEIAAQWLCERDEGFAPGRREAFAAWCAADPRHAAAVRQIEQSLAILEKMPAVRRPLEARFGPLEVPPAPGSAHVLRQARFAWVAGLAALLVVGLAGWWAWGTRPAEDSLVRNETALARRVLLRDGSVVNLNAHSLLRVDYSARERRVRLEAGEAHFEVMHDPARPFVAAAGGVAVRAIGTAFNVRLAPTTVEVLVEEGRVEVAPVASPVVPDAAPAAPPRQLGSGERARVPLAAPATAPQIERVEPRELRAALAWHSRTIVLADEPLAEIVARFNRRNTVQLVLAESDLQSRRLGGVVSLDQVDAFVALLERGGEIVADRRHPGEIVLRRAP